MKIENEQVLASLENVYSQDLTAKTHEIAILRAINSKLQSELDSLQSQLSNSTNNQAKKEG